MDSRLSEGAVAEVGPPGDAGAVTSGATAPVPAQGSGAPEGTTPTEADRVPPTRTVARPVPVKIIVAGGFGVGKTTFVGAVSEITPLTTEAAMTSASLGVDDTSKVSAKTTTTVAMDFGRISLPGNVILYLFGTPGQDRFWFMWDELVRGAIGAVVLVDTRRLADVFPAVDFFESRGLPFLIGLNDFDGVASHEIDDVREALALPDDVPIMRIDARSRESAKAGLVGLVRHALTRVRS